MDTLNFSKRHLESYEQTIHEIYRMARDYVHDLDAYAKDGIFSFYNRCRGDLAYVSDLPQKETLSRPRYTVDPKWTGPRDCDDKSLLLVTFCNMKEILSRLVVCGAYCVFPKLPEMIAILGPSAKTKDRRTADQIASRTGIAYTTPPHHVYPEVMLNKQWYVADATYRRCRFDQRLYTEHFRRVFDHE